MNERKVVILPFDGYSSGDDLLKAMSEFLSKPGLDKLISHIKLNDGVHLGGADFVDALASEIVGGLNSDVKIFLDLKIYDVSPTMVNVLKKYKDIGILDILTISSQCSVDGISKLRNLLPSTKLAMVSVLTDLEREECQARFGMSPEVKIYNDLMNIEYIYKKQMEAASVKSNRQLFDMVVCSEHELSFLTKNLSDSCGFIVPAIRDEWMKKPDEPQKRISGVRKALDSGATNVVMFTQLVKGNPHLKISAEESCRRTIIEISKSAKSKPSLVVENDPLQTLKNCDGYYGSPKDENGKYLGPLVAYAGKYDCAEGQKNFVGFEYFNFAKAETKPEVLNYFAGIIAKGIKHANDSLNSGNLENLVIVGAPMGGIMLATAVGKILGCRTVFAEKKVTAVAVPENGIKEESRQIIDRHEINPGDNVWLVEDVCNNFSTTEKIADLIQNMEAEFIGITCAVNRSGKLIWENWLMNPFPVLCALNIQAQQFKQDDPEVIELVKAGNIVWKAKSEWPKLKRAMEQ